MSRICDICRGYVNRNEKDRLPATWFCAVNNAKGSGQFLCGDHHHQGACCVELGPAVECIDIVEHLPFNIGNAIKYLWRAGIKATPTLEDLEKARWYVEREIRRLKRPPVTITPEIRQRVRDMIYSVGEPPAPPRGFDSLKINWAAGPKCESCGKPAVTSFLGLRCATCPPRPLDQATCPHLERNLGGTDCARCGKSLKDAVTP